MEILPKLEMQLREYIMPFPLVANAPLRMDYVEYAWNGIGDDTWRWIGFKSHSS